MENLLPLLPLLLLIAALMLFLLLHREIHRSRERRERDGERTLETLLLPKEAVKLTCRSRGGEWILTNKRLIIREKSGYTALPFKKIKKVSGKTSAGKTTSAPAKMAALIVQAEREYTLTPGDENFQELARRLKEKTKKKPAAGKRRRSTAQNGG